jgi:hypothetical protein
MTENWCKETCECGTVNWIFLGDATDETIPDAMGYICRSCQKPYSYWDGFEGYADDTDSYEVGLEKPEL